MEKVIEDQDGHMQLLSDFLEIYFPEGKSNVPFANLDRSHVNDPALKGGACRN